jgi:ribosomal protein S21
MNNNPLKRKSEFYEDLEKVRKRKDNSIKKRKKDG